MDPTAFGTMVDEPERDLSLSAAWPTQELFGVPIQAVTMDDVLCLVDETIQRRSRLLIGVVNAAKMVNIRRDSFLRESVFASDIILADGIAVVWALRLLGRRLPERVAGIDLMTGMLERGRSRGYRIYCLGASEEVSRAVVDRIGSDYSGVVVAGRRNGYFDVEDEAEIVADICNAKPDIIFVAMSSPKKEQFLARWSGKLDVPVCHGVGGSFDVLAGKVRRAPLLWQRLGMEWLYRVFQEPRRMWRRYLVTNAIFGWMLLGEMVSRILGRKAMRT